ncbi:MAG: hypothetical protein WHT65_05860, partial [Pseudothermotoga sp.]
MRRYRATILFLLLSLILGVLAFLKGRINADYIVFLPGYKPGLTMQQIDNEDLKALLKVSERFSDGTQVVLILHSEDTFFLEEHVTELVKLQEELSKVEGLKTVLSVLNYTFKTPYFNGKTINEKITEDPEAKSLISADGKYILLNCMLQPTDDTRPILRRIESVLKNYQRYSPLVFGQVVINDSLFSEIIKQILVYPTLMFSAILVVFWLQTRSLKASLLSLFIPLLATVIVYGFSALLGIELNVMTVMCVS